MYRDKTILAIVPARSGSKRIPDKNMQEINGISLIGWAGKCLQELDWIDNKIISTDSADYAEEGRKCDLIWRVRPIELSRGDTQIEDVLAELSLYDINLLIEPTSPMRRPGDIKNAVDMLIDSGADSVVSVSELDTKYNFNRLLRFPAFTDRISYAFGLISASSYQNIKFCGSEMYYRNGICYALTRETVQKRQIITGNTLPLIIDRPVVNIDTPLDLEIARMLMKDE